MRCGAVDPECTRCRLHKGRKMVVPGIGPCDSRIMFVGEAPGRDEDMIGVPFVGRAGKLLDQALVEAGAERSCVRISNLVKCRPPGNRRPRKDEKDTCVSLHLRNEIKEVSPKVICALGHTVAEHLSGRRLRMADVVGKEIANGVCGGQARLFVTYHPAACLYQRRNSEAFKEGVRASLVAAGLARKERKKTG